MEKIKQELNKKGRELNFELKACFVMGIQEIIILICFVVLAIVFQKWWIALFALFFWRSSENVKRDNEETNEQKGEGEC